jgi:signal transduction histidine kinase
MTVCDNGPGFPAAKLEDSSTSLHRLRETARGIGGDLYQLGKPEDNGACVAITVPLRIPER